MEIASWSSIMFYKNKKFISKYPESNRINICSADEFEINRDSFVNNWITYDFNKQFFWNFKELYKNIKFSNLDQIWKNENTDFSDTVVNSKNIYLSSTITEWSENIYYSVLTRIGSKNVVNSLFVVNNSEIIYFSKSIINSYKIYYSSFINNCNDIWFSSNLTWCRECIFCENLDNISYYIKNKKYEKQEYFKKKEEILKNKISFLDYYKWVSNKGTNHNSKNVTWNNILECEDIESWFYIHNIKNWKNLLFCWSKRWWENWYDYSFWWNWNNNVYWANTCWWWCDNLYCSSHIWFSSNIYYSQNLLHCSYCIWCIWLKNKSYCIFNKQYSKKDWEILAEKIFSQMENDWILWDFFPWKINPFYFNDTIAGLIWWFKKEDAIKNWYMWRDEKIKIDIPEWAEIVKTKDLNNYQWFDENWNWKIDPNILKKVIVDEKGDYYRIVKMEYNFLLKNGLPIPEIHWMDRLKLNFGV